MCNKLKHIFIVIGLCALPYFYSFAQCPQRDSLWQRLVFLRDFAATAPPTADQLKELLKYKSQIDQCSYRYDSTHALLLQRIGVLYSRQDDYVNAIKYIKESIQVIIANEKSRSVNTHHLIRNYYILSFFYNELGRTSEKMKAADDCIAIAIKERSVDAYMMNSMWDRIDYSYDIGDYKRSYDIAEAGEAAIKQFGHDKNSADYVTSFQALKVKALLAMREYDKVQKELQNKIEECIKTGALLNLGTIWEQMAEVFAEKGDLPKAEQYFQKAFQYDIKRGYKLGGAQTLNNLAYLLYFKKYRDFDKAIITYKKSILLLSDPELDNRATDFERLNIYGNLASVFVQKSLYDSAGIYFKYAFDQIQPGIDEYTIFQNSLIDTIQYNRVSYLAALMTAKGDACVKRYRELNNKQDLVKAIRIYKLTDQLLDRARTNQYEIQSKLFWRNDSRRLCETAIEACLLSGDINNAFYFFEKSRAVLLSDQLREENWLNEKDILTRAQFKRNILLKEREITGLDKSDTHYRDLNTEIFTIKQELNQLELQIGEKTPAYYKSLMDTNSIQLNDVQKRMLQQNRSLVEIFEGDSAVYVIIVTGRKTDLARINKNDFDSLSHSLAFFLSDPVQLNQGYKKFLNVSNRLYQLIFQKTGLPGNAVIISPDGQYFPFEVLVTNSTTNPVTFFLNDHAVSYTYSARFLLSDLTLSSTRTDKSFMGIAPVNYPPDFALAPLPGSDHSLVNISYHFHDGVNLVAASASRNNFMNQFYRYKIIQLYTHASGSNNKGEPVIFFADSALYLSDLIRETNVLTRLIVLSACETGLGKEYKGEGVFSFNRGFAALGIPSSVTNLWMADNESTYKITELFYKYIAEGLPLDVALQKAKLEFIKSSDKETQLPYYWATSILVGNTDSLEIHRKSNRPYYMAAIGILVLLFLLFIAIGKRRQATRNKF